MSKIPIPKTIYQIKVTLKGSKPPIWRRIQVASDIKLGKLHQIIQSLMGWGNCHLHQFQVGNVYYTDLDADIDIDCFDDAIDEKKVKLDSILKKLKQKIIYEYDFGDSWEHELLLEKILPAEKGISYPLCLDGKRACPPEDCGGVWGYEELLTILKNPSHPEYEERVEWIPKAFDPEEFDLEEVQAAMKFTG